MWTVMQGNANMIFGGITVICGLMRTIVGGFVLDFMTNTIPNEFFKVGAFEFREGSKITFLDTFLNHSCISFFFLGCMTYKSQE